MRSDLRTGAVAEEFVKKIFLSAGIAAEPNNAAGLKKLAEYDLKADMDGRPFTLECKFDLYEAKSGNVAIEFYNPERGRPSGLGSTKADLWVHVLTDPQTAWVAQVSDLKEYVALNKPRRTIANAGDGNASLHLYRREKIFAAVFTRIDELSPEELRRVLSSLLLPKAA